MGRSEIVEQFNRRQVYTVVATVAQDAKGNALNVNADTAAGAVAAALNAKSWY